MKGGVHSKTYEKGNLFRRTRALRAGVKRSTTRKPRDSKRSQHRKANKHRSKVGGQRSPVKLTGLEPLVPAGLGDQRAAGGSVFSTAVRPDAGAADIATANRGGGLLPSIEALAVEVPGAARDVDPGQIPVQFKLWRQLHLELERRRRRKGSCELRVADGA